MKYIVERFTLNLFLVKHESRNDKHEIVLFNYLAIPNPTSTVSTHHSFKFRATNLQFWGDLFTVTAFDKHRTNLLIKQLILS